MNNEILKTINEAAEKFGRLNLSSGNCGQFSLAIAQYLKEKGYKPEIGILHKYDEDVKDLDDLACEEIAIYHIVITIDNNIFDSTGKITTDDLIEFSSREYNDSEPSYIHGIDIDKNAMALKTIINFETDWTIEACVFYDFIKKNNAPKTNINRSLNHRL